MIQRLMIKVTDTIFINDFQLIFFSVYSLFEIYPRRKEAVNQEFLHMTKKFFKDISVLSLTN